MVGSGGTHVLMIGCYDAMCRTCNNYKRVLLHGSGWAWPCCSCRLVAGRRGHSVHIIPPPHAGCGVDTARKNHAALSCHKRRFVLEPPLSPALPPNGH